MFIKEKREATILPVLAAALGVFLVANGGILAAGHSPKMMNAEMPVAANPAPDSVCQVVLDASEKLFTTPYHLYMTQTSVGIENAKPIGGEAIFAGGAQYVLVNGKWQPSPLSLEEMKAMAHRNRDNARNVSCQYVRDESVNGESTAVYTMHSETERSKNDDQVWISKSRGLILREETDLIPNSGNAKAHLSSRYEYSNVQAPTP